MIDPLYTMALTTGLLGAGHCIGMCGGIVAALSISGEGQRSGLLFHLLYNLGRTATYTLIGFLVGWLGSAIAYSDAFRELSRIILIGSDIFIILVGLGTAGLFSFLNVMKLEFPGPFRKMTEVISGLRKLPPGIAALPIGLIMGFIPCGFLYAMAITAAQSADPVSGAWIMLAFGLGTAPSLFLFGLAAHWLGTRARLWMMRGAGIMVALMGCWNLFKHLKMMGLV